jgi:hypothetical protein
MERPWVKMSVQVFLKADVFSERLPGLPGLLVAYTSLMRPILLYGAACWDPYKKGQINALDRVQNNVAKFAYHRNDSNWKRARICAVYKAYT